MTELVKPPTVDYSPHPTSATSVGYNPFDHGFAQNPYAFYATARRDAPVCYSPLHDVWVVSGYDEIVAVARDPILFSSADNLSFPFPLPAPVEAVMKEGFYPIASGLFNNDPPGHTRARALAMTAFTPARVASMEQTIRALAHSLVDAFVKEGHAELMSQFAHPLPMTVIADLISLPRKDMAQVKAWHDDFMTLFTPDLPLEKQFSCARSLVAYQHYYAALIEERRVDPRDDLTTALVQARLEDTKPFTTEEMVSQLILLLSAGHETTTSLIGTMLRLLLENPEQWRALGENPSLATAAIDESLRFEAPVQMEPRTTTAPAELGGVTIPRGARLHIYYGSANRDSAAFKDPDRFDIHRSKPQRHLAFGHGIHFCIGAGLARLEGRLALEVLRERLPNLRLAPGFAVEYSPSFFFRQPNRIDIVWDS